MGIVRGAMQKGMQKAMRWTHTQLCDQTLSILIYHQVAAERDPLRPDVPDRAEFDWQMALLREQFNPLPLAEAVERLQRGELPPRALCVTFDDGYRDNLTVALPVLQKYAMPATVFVATGFTSGANMWNDRIIDLVARLPEGRADFSPWGLGSWMLNDLATRRRCYQQLLGKLKYLHHTERLAQIDAFHRHFALAEAPALMMNPEEIRQLAAAGVEIGAHTVDHPILKTLPAEDQYQQIQASKQTLEAITGRSVTGFAYPNGKPGQDYDKEAVSILRELGFGYAVSTAWGSNRPQDSGYELKRFTPWEKQPLRFQRRLLWNGLKTRLS